MSARHRGRRDQLARAQLAPAVAAGALCWQCQAPIEPGQEWDAGHVDDLATGGAPAGTRLPEHRRRADCAAGGNRARGAHLGNQLRRRRRLAEWLE